MMADKRRMPKLEKIKDGMLNPGKIFITQNGLALGDIVRYEVRPKHFWDNRLNNWNKNINKQLGRVVNIKRYGFGWKSTKEVFQVCVEFFNDIGNCSAWKFGRWRHSRWLWEDSLTKMPVQQEIL